MTRIANTHAALRAHPGEDVVLVSERSILTDRHVFAEMLHASGQLSEIEWDLYQRWYAMLADKMIVDGILWVDTVPDVCSERIARRNRTGEHVPMGYLRDLDAAHRAWVSTTETPVLTLPSALCNDRDAIVREVRGFVARLRGLQAVRNSAPPTPIAIAAPRAASAASADPVDAEDAEGRPAACKTPSKARQPLAELRGAAAPGASPGGMPAAVGSE
jgi:hypothetical protein